MQVSDIVNVLEQFAPPSLAAFDYRGLIYGYPEQAVERVGVALDGTLEVLRRADQEGIELLILHHGLNLSERPTRLDVEKLMIIEQTGLAVYRAHLNLDFCPGGLIDRFSRLLGFTNARPVHLYYRTLPLIFGGVYVSEGNALRLPEILKQAVSGLGVNRKIIRVVGKRRSLYRRVALATGGGAQPGFITQLRADAFIIGEASHLAHLEAIEAGCTLIEVGHHSEELPLEQWMNDFFRRSDAFNETECVFLKTRNPLLPV